MTALHAGLTILSRGIMSVLTADTPDTDTATPVPMIYDVDLDQLRPVTQADVDAMQTRLRDLKAAHL
jgi:hypothetical protein